MTASMPAAPTGAMPKSPHKVIQWVWIRPLVLSAADEEGAEQDPEGPAARGVAQRHERRAQQRQSTVLLAAGLALSPSSP